MLFGGDSGHGLEPVSEMGGSLLDRPVLHNSRNGICERKVKGPSVFDGLSEAFVCFLWQALTHYLIRKYHTAEDRFDSCHLARPFKNIL